MGYRVKLFETITDSNFQLYAAQNYYNPACIDIEEFEEDLKRFKYIKRLITRYTETRVLSTNLILNHLIVISMFLVTRLGFVCLNTNSKNINLPL